MVVSRAQTRNLLLRSLPEKDFARLQPHLRHTSFARGKRLVETDQAHDQVWFPEDGISSVVLHLADGGDMEVGIVGRDGMVPVAALLSADSSPHEIYVQIEGRDALAMPSAIFRDLLREHTGLRESLLRFASVFLAQTTSTAVSACIHPIEQRLSRWILMCHDRLDGDDVRLTHELMALMLGVRRSSVTVTLHALVGMGAIGIMRGTVAVVDRALLQDIAGEAYGTAEAEHRKLIGPFPVFNDG